MQGVKGKLNIDYGIKIIEPVKNNFIGSFFWQFLVMFSFY